MFTSEKNLHKELPPLVTHSTPSSDELNLRRKKSLLRAPFRCVCTETNKTKMSNILTGCCGGARAGHELKAAQISKQSIQSLFTEQSVFLDQFFQTLDFEETAKFCQKVLDCKGTTLFTGIGKSSYIAKKVCQTLVSTGTRAIHLAPVDALHGDIGNVNEGDIVVLFSKSGTTEELVNLVPYAKAKGGFLVAATANKESQLAKLCDMHVTIPAPGELQPFEKGSSSVGTSESRVSPPVTYTALQMMFGDTCAVYIMQARGLTQDEYAMNHPAGRIGKRLVLRVQDVMRKIESLPTVSPEEKGLEVLVKMAGDTKGCGCLLVVDKDMTLLGTFSDGDLRRATVAKGAEVSNLLVKDLMNYNKAFPRCCEAEQMAYEAQMSMNLNGKMVDYLPVISGDGKKTLFGLITIESLSEAGM